MNDLISEFFIDIITRVIPGFIILALYPDKLFTCVFSKFHNLPVLLIPCLIGAAWVIGFAIERATYVPFAFIIRFRYFKRGKKQKDLERQKGFIENLIGDHAPVECFKSDDPDLKKNFDYFKFNRRHELKLTGERIFCRVMFGISIFTLWPPSLALLNGDDRWPIWHHIPLYGLLGMFVFGLAWRWLVINDRKDSEKSKNG